MTLRRSKWACKKNMVKKIRDENIRDVLSFWNVMNCHQIELPIAVPAEFPQRVWGLQCGNLPSPANVRPVVDAPRGKTRWRRDFCQGDAETRLSNVRIGGDMLGMNWNKVLAKPRNTESHMMSFMSSQMIPRSSMTPYDTLKSFESFSCPSTLWWSGGWCCFLRGPATDAPEMLDPVGPWLDWTLRHCLRFGDINFLSRIDLLSGPLANHLMPGQHIQHQKRQVRHMLQWWKTCEHASLSHLSHVHLDDFVTSSFETLLVFMLLCCRNQVNIAHEGLSQKDPLVSTSTSITSIRSRRNILIFCIGAIFGNECSWAINETGPSDFWKAQEVSHMVSFSQTKATKRGYSNSMI